MKDKKSTPKRGGFIVERTKLWKLNWTKTLLMTALCCLISAQAVKAEEEEKPTADLSVSFLSQYIWRGFEYSQDSLVIQPSMTVEYKGFGFNLWGNLDTDPIDQELDNWNETDMTVYYGREFGKLAVSAGYVYYAIDGEDDSQEVFASVGLDMLLNPTITVYREIYKAPSWYVTLGVSQSIPLVNDVSLDLGAQIGYLYSDDAGAYYEPEDPEDELRAFHDCLLSASVPIPVSEYFTITPEAYYSFPLSDDSSDLIKEWSFDGDDDNFFYGGVTVSLAF
jgi:hypothetical protein